MYSRRTRKRERAWRRDLFRSALVLAGLFALGILIVALSGTDHDRRCKQPKPSDQYRAIESHHYGTPAGAPFTRLTGGKTTKTYWTNDTTPVQVTDALCDPSLDFEDPSNPTPHKPHEQGASVYSFCAKLSWSNSFPIHFG